MGLIEGIVGEIHNLIINGLGRRLRDPLDNRARYSLLLISIDEDHPLGLDDLLLFLGDGAADVVCLAHGIASQRAEYLNHLLLVDDAAIGDPQNRLQQRRFVGNILWIQLVRDKFWNGIHGAGAVQGHDSRQVLDGGWLHIDAHTGDARRFQLEYALGLALGKHGVGLRVLIGHVFHGEVRLRFPDLPLRLVDYRQVAQTQKVHLQ